MGPFTLAPVKCLYSAGWAPGPRDGKAVAARDVFRRMSLRPPRNSLRCERGASDPTVRFASESDLMRGLRRGREAREEVNWIGVSRGAGTRRRRHASVPAAAGIEVGTMGSTASVTSAGEEEDSASVPKPVMESPQLAFRKAPLLDGWKPPRYLWRSVACLVIAGQVVVRVIQGKIHIRNSIQQMESVGPKSLGVSLLTASFVGMVFTIQFVREFARLGLTRSVGGVLALALARELSPVVTAIILAGRVGSAFAAELGTMQVSEQTDTLRVLRTDPVDYLITPRVIACCVSLPILTLICFSVGMAASVLLADSVYNVSSNIILDSAARALQPWDIISTSIKATVFGGIISIVSCSWGVTTSGGAKGVGESTTSAVVISLVCIFIADFILSWCFFQGAGDALKAAMG